MKRCFFILFLFLLLSPPPAFPYSINIQGKITRQDGFPAADTANYIQTLFYTAETNGDQLWFETHRDVPLNDGVYRLLLGETNPIDPAWFASGDVFLEICFWETLETPAECFSPRQKLTSVPSALHAETVSQAGLPAFSLEQVSGGALSTQDALEMHGVPGMILTNTEGNPNRLNHYYSSQDPGPGVVRSALSVCVDLEGSNPASLKGQIIDANYHIHDLFNYGELSSGDGIQCFSSATLNSQYLDKSMNDRYFTLVINDNSGSVNDTNGRVADWWISVASFDYPDRVLSTGDFYAGGAIHGQMANDTVNSGAIVDGSIVDADIAPGASISADKITGVATLSGDQVFSGKLSANEFSFNTPNPRVLSLSGVSLGPSNPQGFGNWEQTSSGIFVSPCSTDCMPSQANHAQVGGSFNLPDDSIITGFDFFVYAHVALKELDFGIDYRTATAHLYENKLVSDFSQYPSPTPEIMSVRGLNIKFDQNYLYEFIVDVEFVDENQYGATISGVKIYYDQPFAKNGVASW